MLASENKQELLEPKMKYFLEEDVLLQYLVRVVADMIPVEVTVV